MNTYFPAEAEAVPTATNLERSSGSLQRELVVVLAQLGFVLKGLRATVSCDRFYEAAEAEQRRNRSLSGD